MSHLHNYRFLLFICFISKCAAFLPTKTAGDSNSTFTHSDITSIGINRAVSQFLVEQHLVTNKSGDVIGDFFGSDNDQKHAFYSTISEVVTAIYTFQGAKFTEAKYSVNGEQIEEAHHVIIQKKNEIKALLQQPLTPTIISEILKKIGQCLFVIQSFYSNTNWVEKFGNNPNPDFGVEGVTLMPTAPPGVSTCRNCRGPVSTISADSCKDTVINNNYLTSGYRSGQDIYKVQLQGNLEGKCSHGGPNDNSSSIPATGGINKETPDFHRSPHANLHQQAAQGAIQATVNFLIDKSRGIITYMNAEIFKTLFSLRARKSHKSLAVCLDVSGSMTDDIAAVKSNIINVISSSLSTNNEPENYVLATFNDPESLTQGWNSTDGNVIRQKVSGLIASGGGDCPEYSLSGILKAIELSLPGSTVYHFTDADAKDCYRVNEVMAAAVAKNITLSFLLTGNCTGFICHHRAKRMDGGTSTYSGGIHRIKAVRSLFDQLASGTGGIVQDTTKREISNVLHGLIKNDFPSSQVIIDTFSVPVTSGNDISVYADADMQVMKIEVTGPASVSEVILQDPTGSTITGNGTVGRYFSSNKAILSVQHPKAGTWTIERTVTKEWKVNITAEARIDISFSFKETDENGFPYEISGNPIAGRKYTMEIKVSNLPGDPISTEAVLVSDKRDPIANFTTTLSSGITGKIARISMVMLKKEFRIQLRCRYQNSSWNFRRTSERLITPVTVQLSLQKIFDAVEIGALHKLFYIIANTGSSNQTFTVKYTDDKNYHLSVQNSHEHLLSPGQQKRAFFNINGTKDAEAVKYNISVYEKGSNQILQTAEDTIMFTSIVHPKCKVVARHGNCSFLNSTVDCKKYSWNASTSVIFSGIKLNSVSLGNEDSNVKVHHAALSKASSPFQIDISGSCCTPSVLVNVRDTDSYVGTCLLKFGDPSQVQEHTVDTVHAHPVYQDTDNSINAGAITGITIGVVVIIGVLVFGYFLVTKKIKQAAKKRNEVNGLQDGGAKPST